MKLMIEIDDEVYQHMMGNDLLKSVHENICYKAVCNGTPIPDNATNGDVIMAMFPDAEIHLDGNDVFIHHMGFWIKCNIRWWNTPYQKGGKE